MSSRPADNIMGIGSEALSLGMVSLLLVAFPWFRSKPEKRRTLWCLLGWHRPDPDSTFSGNRGGQYKCRICGTWIVFHD